MKRLDQNHKISEQVRLDSDPHPLLGETNPLPQHTIFKSQPVSVNMVWVPGGALGRWWRGWSEMYVMKRNSEGSLLRAADHSSRLKRGTAEPRKGDASLPILVSLLEALET